VKICERSTGRPPTLARAMSGPASATTVTGLPRPRGRAAHQRSNRTALKEAVRRWSLAEALEHLGQIDLKLDRAKLRRLRGES